MTGQIHDILFKCSEQEIVFQKGSRISTSFIWNGMWRDYKEKYYFLNLSERLLQSKK